MICASLPMGDSMQTVKRDQLWDVLRGGEWCRAHVVNVVSDRVNLQFSNANLTRGNAVMVTLAEMKEFAKFRFVADSAEPQA
jgi:hypothetical protein